MNFFSADTLQPTLSKRAQKTVSLIFPVKDMDRRLEHSSSL